MTATEIAPSVLAIDLPLGERVNSVYAVVGSGATLLYDTGVDGSATAIRDALTDAGVTAESVQWAVVSHCDVDHFGGVASVREVFPNARLAAHRLDAPLVEDFDVYERDRARGFLRYGLDETPDGLAWVHSVTRTAPLHVWLSGDERIDLGGVSVELRHTPGHSAGCLSCWLPGQRAALISDAILGSAVPLADGSPAFPPTYRFVEDYRATIEAVRAWRPRLLATAHYGRYLDAKVAAFLDESAAFADRLQAELDRALATGPATLAQLADTLSARVGEWPVEGSTVAMAFPVTGHLEAMQRLGRATCGEDQRWTLT